MDDFSPAARARLAMSYDACELAEGARRLVGARGFEGAGAAVEGAGRVLDDAHRLLEAAVVFARVEGADWAVVGDSLGLSAGDAQERFGPAEARFRGELQGPTERAWRQYLVREPLEAALDLDDWVRRHADGDDDPGPAPVSGPLTS
ncbi:hypothetical protein OG394_02500 [Kribbella sp. NBC_01245]|uniref:hypothetical protein n=1 Tax=Kribbella sp. NBC_01245 TaxID=2903578 RepID=UPI002E280F37|nr:hypothetical protein [Kribbella sp. NBC_01245]